MAEPAQRALLPAGVKDMLPPAAAFEAASVDRLMAACAAYGYERVKPPLVEFEDSLLSGSGAAMAPHTFRLMDPVSQRMLAMRADMTLQVARIAATRLNNAARPLRLSYAGQVLRVKGDELRPERQVGQVGAELIGAPAPAADAEVVVLSASALTRIGVADLSVDLSSPKLVPAVLARRTLAHGAGRRLREALDRKDAAGVAAHGGAAASTLLALLAAAGPAPAALAALIGIELPAEAKAEVERLAEVAALVRAAAPALRLTIDPVENRGFEYHSGLCFTLFATGVRGELGRGGRYLAGEDLAAGRGEPATGFTLFMDSVLRALPEPPAPRKIFIPLGMAPEVAAKWRAEGWVAVAGLAAVAEPKAEARRLGCSHVAAGEGAMPAD
ncbi:MAG: ATP phosphoribosyltransferase regulatory subunit [Pseudomonadota bacterium]